MAANTRIVGLVIRYFREIRYWSSANKTRYLQSNSWTRNIKTESCCTNGDNKKNLTSRQSAIKSLNIFVRFDAVALLIAMMCASTTLYAQSYPSRPIRIVSAEPGGSGDFLTRLMATGLYPSLGQQIVVDNRGGASGVVAIETVVNAAPDGYTLLSYGSIWILPLIRPKLPYDILRDLAPISLLASSPNVLVVHPSMPVSSVKDLIALARAKPGTINYGTGGTGSSSHLAAELFRAMSGANITRVPYRGVGQALTALIGGQVDMSFASAGSAAQHIKAGRLKPLGVTSARRTALLPDLPAIAETVPGYESVYMLGMFAPAKTPQPIIARLNKELVHTVNTPEMKDRFFKAGVEVVGGTPEEFRAAVESEMLRLGKVIKDANIHEE